MNTRRIHSGLIIILTVSTCATAQFKSQTENQPAPSQSLIQSPGGMGSVLGLFNPDNFLMRHSLSFSYFTAGGTGLSLTSYTNTMLYKISDPLNLRFDVTLQGSPFGNYGGVQQSELSKIYLSRAELNYRPAENMSIRVQYLQLPYSAYRYDWYSPYSYPYLRGDQ